MNKEPKPVQAEQRTADYEALLREARRAVAPDFAPGAAYADDKRLFQGIPGIARAPGGRMWAVWYAGGQGESPLNYVLAATSDNDGESWSAPVLVIDPPGHVRACDANVWLDPTGRLWLFWMQAHTLHDGQWGVWAITTDHPDGARPTWSTPRRIADGVMLNKPTVLRNGHWLAPISHLTSKPLDNEKKMLPVFLRRHIGKLLSEDRRRAIDQRHGAYVYASEDGGETFAPRGAARAPMNCATHNEHLVVERNDGSLWMLLRTSYGIGQSTSADGGRTWEPVTDSGIAHVASRFFFGKLQSGAILLVKHGPMRAPASHKFTRSDLRAYLSTDDGRSWSDGLVIEPRNCTYPDAVQAPDGTIYVVYDHGRRKEKMILMARFTEQDVVAGRFVSPRARPKMLVNQATGVIPDAEDWAHSKGKDDPDEPLIFTGI